MIFPYVQYGKLCAQNLIQDQRTLSGYTEGGIYIVFVRKIVPNNTEKRTPEAINS